MIDSPMSKSESGQPRPLETLNHVVSNLTTGKQHTSTIYKNIINSTFEYMKNREKSENLPEIATARRSSTPGIAIGSVG